MSQVLPQFTQLPSGITSFGILGSGGMVALLPNGCQLPIGLLQKKKRNRYAAITDEARKKLIDSVVIDKKDIKTASEECGINISTATGIVKTYLNEGRIGKKKTRMRKKKEVSEKEEANEKQPKAVNFILPPIVKPYPYMMTAQSSMLLPQSLLLGGNINHFNMTAIHPGLFNNNLFNGHYIGK
eukprot:TRINITY_DN3097_c0_g1_i2.p1 TRINITY_DN3097_c0_g1~~TRINITY_DN3097_c0_g1_i2.p1  ORF type:complete len:184 (+),score=27.78 TRINITY_DN3097_c0_g1_i2:23-574(+)